MLYIVHTLKHGDGPENNKITTVDVCDVNDPYTGAWRSSKLPSRPAQIAKQLGCADRVTFVAQSSIAYLKNTTETFDGFRPYPWIASPRLATTMQNMEN